MKWTIMQNKNTKTQEHLMLSIDQFDQVMYIDKQVILY